MNDNFAFLEPWEIYSVENINTFVEEEIERGDDEEGIVNAEDDAKNEIPDEYENDDYGNIEVENN